MSLFNSDELPPKNITPMRPGIQLPLTSKRKEHCKEWCRRVVVDEKTRMLECECCKRVMEPFDYVWEWAVNGNNLAETHRDLDRQIRQKREELEKLKTLVTQERAKARKAGVPDQIIRRIQYDVQFKQGA